MSHVLTLVASSDDIPITDEVLAQVTDLLRTHDVEVQGAPTWLSPGKAVDVFVDRALNRGTMQAVRHVVDAGKVDVFTLPVEGRRKKLLMADMDSTIVTGETLDELAAFAGLKDEIAAITTRAMEGELDFHEAIRARVGLLKGLSIDALDQTLAETALSAGANTLVQTMREHGAMCVLVSGGFTFFTNAIARQVGFHKDHGNLLEIAGDELTGTVGEPIQDKFAKLEYLKSYCQELKIAHDAVMSIGDGANDIPMLEAAGFGVGYKPKNTVREVINNVIIHGDLSAALYAQGYTDDEITS